jgi:hypothetical protein
MPRQDHVDHMVQQDEDVVETCLFPSLFFYAKRSVVEGQNSILLLAEVLALSDTIRFAENTRYTCLRPFAL